jgi:outer membrane protein
MKILRILFVFFALTASLFAIDNYAVVNSQEVIFTSKAYDSFNKQMEKYKTEYEKQISKTQDELKALEKELVEKRNEFSPKEFEKRKVDFEKRVEKFRNDVQGTQQKFEQVAQETSKAIADNAKKIIQDLVKEKKVEVIFEAMGLLIYPDDKNLTKEVIKRLDAKMPKVDVKKPF